MNVKVIDLFCGIGGLTHGLAREGFYVIAGIDNDDSCKYGYEHNNGAKFIHKDILQVMADEIDRLFGNEDSIKVLVGCAPCQPFSKLNQKKVTKNQLEPLDKFAQLIAATEPDIVSMENVPGLADMKKYPIFESFIGILEERGYEYSYEIVDVSEYGIPQSRKRLVVLASKYGMIRLIPRTHLENKITVRKAIGHLEPIRHGETSKSDPFHRARKLSKKNLDRIKATPHDGGNSSSWNEELLLNCHKKDSGKSYSYTVYGRMRWNEPAPTMTTHCVGLGNGRFGHPEQDRAISLREAAIFQSFPEDYQFSDPSSPIFIKHVARFIGNAIPVRLASVIGKSIIAHLENHEC